MFQFESAEGIDSMGTVVISSARKFLGDTFREKEFWVELGEIETTYPFFSARVRRVSPNFGKPILSW